MHYPARGGRARAAHAVHLEPGRLRGRLPVLCHRASSVSGATSRWPRSSTRSATPHDASRRTAERLTNIVFMGMGEPLLNLDRVLAAVEALNDPASVRPRSAAHHGVSTSGVVPGIRRLTALGPQFTLAVSLHAARDALRDVLVPLNRRWPVAEVVEAAREHGRATGSPDQLRGDDDRRHQRHAEPTPRRWPTCSAGDHAHVEPHPDEPGRPHAVAGQPDAGHRGVRGDRCATAGIGTTIRRNRGQEVGAACGQLAAERAGEPPAPAVARRRERLVMRERRRPARRAQRRAGAGRGGGVTVGTGRARIAASILDADLANLAQQRPARRGGRCGPRPPRRDGRPLRAEPHVRRRRRSRRSGDGPICRSTRTS